MTHGWTTELHGPTGDGIVWRVRAQELAGERVIAPEGDGAWRLLAWPVADAVFTLEAPTTEAVLVADGAPQERAAITERLRAMTGTATDVPQLTLAALRSASVVVLLGGEQALPAAVFAPLAARRVLVAPRRRRTFGLRSGIDMLAADGPEAIVEQANAAVRYPEAFATMRVMGALAAERHRSSALLARLV
jgi:hypothetical protein